MQRARNNPPDRSSVQGGRRSHSRGATLARHAAAGGKGGPHAQMAVACPPDSPLRATSSSSLAYSHFLYVCSHPRRFEGPFTRPRRGESRTRDRWREKVLPPPAHSGGRPEDGSLLLRVTSAASQSQSAAASRPASLEEVKKRIAAAAAAADVGRSEAN